MLIALTDEVLTDGVDLLGQVQRAMVNAHIKKERATLAAITTDELAWIAFPPTRDDNPADYAPYWTRLVDIIADDD